MCGCGRLVDMDSEAEGDEIENDLEVNNYFSVPSAPLPPPPKYEA